MSVFYRNACPGISLHFSGVDYTRPFSPPVVLASVATKRPSATRWEPLFYITAPLGYKPLLSVRHFGSHSRATLMSSSGLLLGVEGLGEKEGELWFWASRPKVSVPTVLRGFASRDKPGVARLCLGW
jgi:hypothetical protein